ncbi:hypothetical protein BDZ90DRAFT_180584 [Jaminaea rosea]|uniref:Uncharacterized protein n=1 Tax=Jaminaea rosea TaxID=1569628 RepID=A0A316UQA5_9BASI|nr:hypothetical protein BDZ90DRAFT_180584 [Jaminaea rosea]PWN27492.1 hypothetical protein BDZ90DRAFT_180584 [Jaminaea rosea]
MDLQRVAGLWYDPSCLVIPSRWPSSQCVNSALVSACLPRAACVPAISAIHEATGFASGGCPPRVPIGSRALDPASSEVDAHLVLIVISSNECAVGGIKYICRA